MLGHCATQRASNNDVTKMRRFLGAVKGEFIIKTTDECYASGGNLIKRSNIRIEKDGATVTGVGLAAVVMSTALRAATTAFLRGGR